MAVRVFGYATIWVILSIAVASALAYGLKRWAALWVVIVSLVAIVAQLGLGYADYQGQTVIGTPWSAYVVGSISSTVCAALTVIVANGFNRNRVCQITVAATAWLLSTLVVTALSATY